MVLIPLVLRIVQIPIIKDLQFLNEASLAGAPKYWPTKKVAIRYETVLKELEQYRLYVMSVLKGELMC